MSVALESTNVSEIGIFIGSVVMVHNLRYTNKWIDCDEIDKRIIITYSIMDGMKLERVVICIETATMLMPGKSV